MSKRKKRKYSISRRINESLWGNKKDPYYKRNYPPGVHGSKGYKKKTNYGSQLLAKQKLKKYYGEVKENQFKLICKSAKKKNGNTLENLIGILESRIDIILYRCNFASTIFSSRQIINHKHVKINNKIVNYPSYLLRPGDLIKIVNKNIKFNENTDIKNVPKYIEVDYRNASAIYLKIPNYKEVQYPVSMDINLVLEFYSR